MNSDRIDPEALPVGREPTDNLWEAMYTQRAIRYFRSDEVPDDLIWRIIEAATRAPSGSNLQPWGFVVIKDRELLRRIGAVVRERIGEAPERREYMREGMESPDTQRRLMMRGANNIFTRLDEVPVLIVPCLYQVRSPAPRGLLAGSSIYQAVQNLLLAARGLGLGAVMATFQHPIMAELVEWLEIPPDAIPVAVIPLGWPDRNFGPVNRRPVEEITHWNGWGKLRARD